ncbi:hypothetical protein G9272_01035 [Streptomyces asoensis]|uniref:Activator of Hsp90 ATPase homologue 1/2-like C-terminal domain-containing protein n=1 Tax=Streptomyces asoensis TaxID=249586 RepID=A0A6M4WER8_9ACTN|nr:SRPBCC domain-containing protein [Streptomyces asoensis]QJS99089.1 hypothetical protein G9272_01035 [Streptomyces asoensis]
MAARQETRAEPATADPRQPVFEAFTEVRHLSRWWGPEGFTTTTRSFEFSAGGEWDFVLHGPDGTECSEWIVSSLAAYVTDLARKGVED